MRAASAGVVSQVGPGCVDRTEAPMTTLHREWSSWTLHRVRVETRIAASPERVWAALTDFTAMPGWSRSLQGIDGELRQGAAVRVRFMGPGGRVGTYAHALVEWEEGRCFRWSDPVLPGVRDNHRYLVEADGDGAVLTQTDEVRGWLAPLLGPLVTSFMLRNYAEFNEALRARVEG